VDRPGAAPTVRAHCDAVEIADLILGRPPEQLSPDEHRTRLLDLQDPATGLVPEFGTAAPAQGIPGSAADPASYHVLAVGYALELLGTGFRHPLTAIATATPAELLSYLDGLPWRERAWSAGHLVDMLGTALRWQTERGEPGTRPLLDALFGWLGTHCDPRTGLWGGDGGPDLLQPVNGFYRASRGTYAQFGLPLPHPERVIDTVLAHAGQPRLFAPDRQNACNVLDVAHPLWLAGRQTGHRRDEFATLAGSLLSNALGRWVERQGFSFRAPYSGGDADPATVPGLQGTEMWLTIIWILADLLGLADVAGYAPRGVHRHEPALRLPSI
jgi:hypothetical protein